MSLRLSILFILLGFHSVASFASGKPALSTKLFTADFEYKSGAVGMGLSYFPKKIQMNVEVVALADKNNNIVGLQIGDDSFSFPAKITFSDNEESVSYVPTTFFSLDFYKNKVLELDLYVPHLGNNLLVAVDARGIDPVKGGELSIKYRSSLTRTRKLVFKITKHNNQWISNIEQTVSSSIFGNSADVKFVRLDTLELRSFMGIAIKEPRALYHDNNFIAEPISDKEADEILNYMADNKDEVNFMLQLRQDDSSAEIRLTKRDSIN